jgi:hypothetical protein
LSLAIASTARPRTSFVPQVPRRIPRAKTDAQAATFGPSQSFGDPNHWLIRAIGGGPTKAGPSVSEYTAHNLPVVYACINRIANPIGFFPLKIFKGDQVEVTDHPLSQKLGLRPNLSCPRARCARPCSATRSWGNGYCEIERNGRGQAVGLVAAAADRTRRKRMTIVSSIAPHQRRAIGARPGRRDPHRWIRARTVIAVSRQIAVARQAIGMGLAMEEFGAKFFANDAKQRRLSLMHPNKLRRANIGQGPTCATAIHADKQGGLDNAHRIKVLDEG